MGENALANRRATEGDFRRRWLQGVLQDYDVKGNQQTNAFSRERKRTWINPENFDRRLPQLLMRAESPVEMWNSVARKLQTEEQRELLSERLGGRLQAPSAEARNGPGRAGAELGSGSAADATASLAARLSSMSARGDGASELGGPADAVADGAVSSLPAANVGSGAAATDAAFLETLKKTIADLDGPPPDAPSPTGSSTDDSK